MVAIQKHNKETSFIDIVLPGKSTSTVKNELFILEPARNFTNTGPTSSTLLLFICFCESSI